MQLKVKNEEPLCAKVVSDLAASSEIYTVKTES